MKILILGSTGMLGNAVGKYFLSLKQYDVMLSWRTGKVAYGGARKTYFDPLKGDMETCTSALLKAHQPDYVINCIGVIKPFMQDRISAIGLNSLFPHILAEKCQYHGIRLIHITTDCVYSGKRGRYVETDNHDALDDYGKSKSLGEPTNAMILRTSIIGEEIHKNASLISWVKSQRGREVNGFANHYWNGITTKQYAKICDQIISKQLYASELYHVFSNAVTKYDMLKEFDSKWDLGLAIQSTLAEPVDRTLSTVRGLNSKLDIPTFEQMVEEL